VKVPEAWLDEDLRNVEAMRRVISDVFRNTGRIAMVVIHVEVWISLPDGAGRFTHFFPEVNSKARTAVGVLEDLIIKRHDDPRKSGWRSLDKIVCTH
jgi:hypothetical protein